MSCLLTPLLYKKGDSRLVNGLKIYFISKFVKVFRYSILSVINYHQFILQAKLFLAASLIVTIPTAELDIQAIARDKISLSLILDYEKLRP